MLNPQQFGQLSFDFGDEPEEEHLPERSTPDFWSVRPARAKFNWHRIDAANHMGIGWQVYAPRSSHA